MSAAYDPDRLAELAARDLENRLIEEAESKCLRALSIERQHRGALNVLGMVLHAQGRHEEAVRVFHALTTFEPHNADYWGNLGTALRPTRRYEAALQAYDRAAQLGGVSANLLYNIAVLHVDRCDYVSAAELFARALTLAPADAGLRLAHAQCLHDAMRNEEAVVALEGWPGFTGLTPEIVAGIAHLLVTMGETRRAEPAVTRVLEHARGGGYTSLRLVRLLERTNRLSEARDTLNRIKARPETSTADPDLLLVEAVLAQREGAEEEACRLFSTLLEHQQDDFPRRYHLLFPLAKSLDALGRPEEAYAAFEEAHRSQIAFIATALGKEPTEGSPAIELARDGCDPGDIATWEDPGAPRVEASPIFIVAFPRSGTTLLEQILDAHPLLRSMDETPFLKWALEDVRACGVHYPTELGKLTAARLAEIRERYWQRVREKVELQPGQRVVDKNPLNMMRLPLIRRLFPHARTVLAVRHPCDTVLSCFQQQFRAPDLALICRDLPTLARNFRTAFDFWYAQEPLLGPAALELRYETLVDDFAAEVRKLAEFLQLPWNEALLAAGEHARAKGYISTPSYSQVIQPVNRKSVGRWRPYRRYFTETGALEILTPCVERWGYGL